VQDRLRAGEGGFVGGGEYRLMRVGGSGYTARDFLAIIE
jgi:hypothetical protein